MRGYKLATLRGLYNDTGIIEEIRFDTVSVHDFVLSEDMIKNSSCLNHGDILINDRGFLSREFINFMKTEKGVDTYVPLKHNMHAYQEAVKIATRECAWIPHPNKLRKMQKISFVPTLAGWDSNNVDNDVPINACVIWDMDYDRYMVLITTDTNATAKDIVLTYELRPEIEEDYRQLKDFWRLEDFKTTKYNIIAFHIICVLLGYLFYQLYINSENGYEYLGRSLPVILKNYKCRPLNHLVLYGGCYFCSMSLKEFIVFRDSCSQDVKDYLFEFLK